MPTDLSINTIVRVIDGDSFFHNCEGQIVGFDRDDKEEPVRVWFGKDADHRLDYHDSKIVHRDTRYATEPPPESKQARNLRTWNFAGTALVVIPDWSVATLANRYFGSNMWHHSQALVKPFILGAEACEMEGCNKPATQRILFNYWGTVIQADACNECSLKYHRKCGEYLPLKRYTTPRTA